MLVSPVSHERYDGPYALCQTEIFWSERYAFLASVGYQLRVRYRPDWFPSWLATGKDPEDCEDSACNSEVNAMDATGQDGQRVTIRVVERGKTEQVMEHLEKRDQVSGSEDRYCVPFLDFLHDPFLVDYDLMITPYLRPFNDPGLTNTSHVVDFVLQTLRALAFLHANQVAHRNIQARNIMMDASSLYPMGHHPIRLNSARDGTTSAVLMNRIRRPVRYYLVDFSRATQFEPGEYPFVVYKRGQDWRLPERTMPPRRMHIDAFKVDVYHLGRLYESAFLRAGEAQYPEAGWPLASLEILVASMVHPRPEMRLPARGALLMAQYVFSKVNVPPCTGIWRTPQPPVMQHPRRVALSAAVIMTDYLVTELEKLASEPGALELQQPVLDVCPPDFFASSFSYWSALAAACIVGDKCSNSFDVLSRS
ncbi:predicted protein [Sparassis crispa]|uniref:Protein kinase domain-containing protein n=1 Tax=Sparassis crispa TaxID=139825 RepID=A0A401GX20_9APHY|nr:predicted protein [Sparassis crispa]GBE86775.1 predicted protein [Sparassis crispa]